MANYFWRDSAAATDGGDRGRDIWDLLASRYAEAIDANGRREWAAFVRSIQEAAPLVYQSGSDFERGDAALRFSLDSLVTRLRRLPAARKVPTVFVSHQRQDADWAEWVGWASTEADLDYWLDVHDLGLASATALVLPDPVKSVLIAGIIEMALVNCTHIVSLQTANAKGSVWVPYEFGRAKDSGLLAQNTVSWFDNHITPMTNGDYLWLAPCAFSSAQLRSWLGTVGPPYPPTTNARWRRPLPAKSLPN